jgi:hypothetical protein
MQYHRLLFIIIISKPRMRGVFFITNVESSLTTGMKNKSFEYKVRFDYSERWRLCEHLILCVRNADTVPLSP